MKQQTQQQLRQHLIELKQLLEQEQAGYHTLQRLLQAQARLLTHQDHQGLLVHNPRQLQVSEQLAELALQREHTLLELGTHSLASLCKRLPATLATALLELWHNLQTQARECRVLNDSNGRLLASQKEWLEQQLNTVQNEYAPDAIPPR